MNGRDSVEVPALLDAARTVSMVLTAVEELADVLSTSRVEGGMPAYPFACNAAFSMLAQYAQSKLGDVEGFLASASELSHAKPVEVSHGSAAA
ncbi:hypothetical protein GXB81_20995 [Paraburkholderia sp. Ac-20336]|uniref:hypothetical protein n=1 Tax=Paraburkholderia sp. Ac-20336 TaxID=2703886 RepID=UPI001980173D|nr:hypothetical protein [Paraburkholderia sp. Ac-20336]MBN3805509.1 hypothetical protein [Paraburkholderia sp. Ac-20336]